MERRLAAVLVADMAGYSRLIERDEEGVLNRQKKHRRELIDPEIAAHKGHIVKTTGDGMLAEFGSAQDAVRCAMDIQAAMVERERISPADTRITYRFGINLGDVVFDDDDIFGDGVNVASRLQGLSEPGGVCVSDIVHQAMSEQFREPFRDMGSQRVKNISRPIRVWQWTPGAKAEKKELSGEALHQRVHFAAAPDGAQIAWASIGQGRPVLKGPNWLNHIEYEWRSPVWGPVFAELARHCRLVRFDQRGNGLSDWDVDEISQDAMIGDMSTVAQAAGLDRFALLGISQGCAFSIRYAVEHPERVTCLVLLGGYLRGRLKRPDPEQKKIHEALGATIRDGWGSPNPIFRHFFTSVFMPDAAPEFASAVNALQCAVDLQQGMAAVNVDQPEDRQIVLRIGVNLGDVMVEGGDLYGDSINIAARLEALAEPGGICVSAKLRDEIGRKLDLIFSDLGEQTLKNIEVPVRVYAVRSARESAASRPALVLPDKPSIAVLPFENMSGDPEQEYFADGMVEEIITALSRMKWLFVIARNSSFTYKGRAVDVKQVGRELGVRYVLEGSVRKAGNKVRITGQLIDASTSAHLWADRFEGTMEAIFELQDQVAERVVGAIAPKLEQAEIERARRKPTGSLDAYDCYLRGLAQMYRFTKEGSDEALSHFRRATELDSGFAAAYGMAARCYAQRKAGRWMTDPVSEIAEAGRLARRAIALGPDDAIALCTAGFAIADVVDELADGDALIDQAITLNPNLAWAWIFSGWVKISLGEPEAAIERISHAMRLSPHDPYVFGMQSAMASAHLSAGRYAEALSWAEKSIRTKPDYLLAACIIAASRGLAEQIEDARNAVAVLLRLDPELRISNLKSIISYLRTHDFAKWVDGLRKAGLPE